MTKEQAANLLKPENIAKIKAFSEGKTIEKFHHFNEYKTVDLETDSYHFFHNIDYYRIKPEEPREFYILEPKGRPVLVFYDKQNAMQMANQFKCLVIVVTEKGIL
jgi:hypothetical protein